MATSCLYRGRVMHRRFRPVAHSFVYDVFTLLLDLDELPALDRSLRLFSVDRPNLLSFQSRDHGARDGSPLRPWVEAELRANGFEPPGGPVRLLCFPRMFGYVFNPLSIYFCHRPDGALAVILYEVKNTFGEQHCYVLPVPAGHVAGSAVRHGCDKAFYVSPFIDMVARYEFEIGEPGERLQVLIREAVPEGPLLLATHTGRRRSLTDAELVRAVGANLLMTFKIFAGIHLEAVRLWLKGAPYFPHLRRVGPERST